MKWLRTGFLFLILLSVAVFAANDTLSDILNDGLSAENNGTTDNSSAEEAEPASKVNETEITAKIEQTRPTNETVNKTELEVNETEEPIAKESDPTNDENRQNTETDVMAILDAHEEKFNQKSLEILSGLEKDENQEFIIKYKTEFDKSKLDEFTKVKRLSNKISGFKGKINDISDVVADDNVELIEIDQDIEAFADNIPFNVEQVGADTAWNLSTGGGISVAVLDTGIYDHDDLAVIGGWNIVDDDSDYSDENGHGTKMTGVLAASVNDEGLIGVSPDVEVYAVKIMNTNYGQLSDAIAGVQWTIDHDIDVVSMSFGYEGYSQIFKEVLEEAYSSGALLVAAAGNDNDAVKYPAAFTSVIAAGAVDSNNNKASFSNHGPELELVAPGVDINSTTIDGYDVGSGTSYSAPHVSGVAALIWAHNNSLSNEQVRGKLQNDALDLGDAGRDEYYGYGLVQADLGSSNYNYTPVSYYYEVYNVTDYGMENETSVFWLNSTGTIDDVDFSQGIYWIMKNLTEGISQRYYNVSESGEIGLLGFKLEYNDDFTSDSSSASDSMAWKGDLLETRIENEPEIDAVCYDLDNDGEYDGCYYRPGMKNDCKSFSQGESGDCYEFYAECNGAGVCNEESSFPSYHEVNTSSEKQGHVKAVYFEQCDNGYQQDCAISDEIYNVFNKRKATCTSTTTAKYEGTYDNGVNWLTYKTKSCATNQECDYDADGQETTSKTADINPCRLKDGESCTASSECMTGVNCIGGVCGGNTCNGSINVVTSASELFVRVNDVSQGQTDETYYIKTELSGIQCGAEQEVEVLCSDNNTVCHSDSVYLSTMGDTATVVDTNCDKVCSTDKNFWLTNADVDVAGNKINVTIHSADLNGTVNITLYKVDKETGLLGDSKELQTSIAKKSTASVNTTWTLTDASALNIYIDKDNLFPQDDKNDNFVYRVIVQDRPSAYLSVNTTNPDVDSLIETYLEQYIARVPTTNQAEFVISVGKYTSEFDGANAQTLEGSGWLLWERSGWGFNGDGLVINDVLTESADYSGIVGRTDYEGKPTILIYGVGGKGNGNPNVLSDIAAVKKFVSARTVFFGGDNPPIMLDKYDTLALGIYDLLHGYSNYSSPAYLKAVNNIFFDNTYDVAIRTVKTLSGTSYNNNTVLRLKNVNSDYSEDFKDVVTNYSNPVVLSHGIHSDLFTWQDFAKDIASSGHDAWLIEAYGGPTTEDCDYGCPNYTFNDLKTYYWPALIAGVQEYSGKDNLSYVGYDLGCTMALESLEQFQNGDTNVGYYFDYDSGQYVYSNISAHPIKTFVGVGCIGNFTKQVIDNQALSTPLVELLNGTYLEARSSLDNHTTGTWLKLKLYFQLLKANGISLNSFIGLLNDYLAVKFPAGEKMSTALYDDFNDWMNDPSKPNVGENVDIENLELIQSRHYKHGVSLRLYDFELNGKNIVIPWPTTLPTKNTDGFIYYKDQEQICNNIQSNNKNLVDFKEMPHFKGFTLNLAKKSLNEDAAVINTVKDFLDNNQVDLPVRYTTNCSVQVS